VYKIMSIEIEKENEHVILACLSLSLVRLTSKGIKAGSQRVVKCRRVNEMKMSRNY